MSDKDIIERLAEVAISLGVDREGMCYIWMKIADKIEELIKKNNKKEDVK